MDLITYTNSMKHLSSLFDRSGISSPFVDHDMNKPLCPNCDNAGELPHITPEQVGASSKYIADYLSEIFSDKANHLHGITVLKDGKVICDINLAGYNVDCWHVQHSLSKSVTAMAIGMLIDEGKLTLDTQVVKLFAKRLSPIEEMAHKNITVRHLLTMSSGVAFTEMGIIVESDWFKAYFGSMQLFEPGKRFHYNSLNSYILSCIVKEITGKTLLEYLRPRLFDPLGITVINWERATDGNQVGGWGLYLRRADVAKLAKLYLDMGVWEGKQIVSKEWIKASTSPQIITPEHLTRYNYGYHIWVGRDHNSYLFNGMFGQDMLAFPKTKTAIIINGGMEQIFQTNSFYEISERYFASKYYENAPIRARAEDKRRLDSVIASLEGRKKSPLVLGRAMNRQSKFLRSLAGRVYRVRQRRDDEIINIESISGTSNLGVLPMVEQLLRNKYTQGISAISFFDDGDGISLQIKEGNCECVLPIRHKENVYTTLHLCKTDYHASVRSELATDEDGREVIKLFICFPEISSSRQIKIYFDSRSVEVRMTEKPGMGLANLAMKTVEDGIRGKKLLAGVVSKVDPDLLYYKVRSSFEPSFFLYLD